MYCKYWHVYIFLRDIKLVTKFKHTHNMTQTYCYVLCVNVQVYLSAGKCQSGDHSNFLLVNAEIAYSLKMAEDNPERMKVRKQELGGKKCHKRLPYPESLTLSLFTSFLIRYWSPTLLSLPSHLYYCRNISHQQQNININTTQAFSKRHMLIHRHSLFSIKQIHICRLFTNGVYMYVSVKG